MFGWMRDDGADLLVRSHHLRRPSQKHFWALGKLLLLVLKTRYLIPFYVLQCQLRRHNSGGQFFVIPDAKYRKRYMGPV